MRKLIAAIVIAVTLFYGAITNKDASLEDEEEPPDISLEAPSPTNPSQEGALQTVLNVTKAEEQRKQAESTSYKREADRRAAVVRIAEEKAEAERVAEELRKAQAEAQRIAALEATRAKVAQAKAAESRPVVSRGQAYVGKAQSYEATFYDALCNTGCTGITASGHDVRNSIHYEGMRILAAPKSVPLYSIMRVTLADGSTFDGIVLDRGGDIGAGRLDILVRTRDEAYRHGRQSVEVRIIRKGR